MSRKPLINKSTAAELYEIKQQTTWKEMTKLYPYTQKTMERAINRYKVSLNTASDHKDKDITNTPSIETQRLNSMNKRITQLEEQLENLLDRVKHLQNDQKYTLKELQIKQENLINKVRHLTDRNKV